LLTKGADLIAAQFGTTAFTIDGLGAVPNGQWNDLGRTETLELNGRRIAFSVLVEFPRSTFPTTPLADLLALTGKLVTRSDDGKVFRIVGEVAVDELTVRFPLDSRHK
jgi:hypothetical protein